MPDPQLAPILLLTRPEAAARRFMAQLGPTVETLLAPLMWIELLEPTLVPPDVTAIILTSENGAAAAGRISGLPRRAYCVGDRTAQTAREAGFEPMSAKGEAEALICLILSQNETGPLLHIRGEHVRGDLAGRLNVAGVVTQEMTGYRQHSQSLSPAAITLLAGKRPVILPLFSPRSVTILARDGPFAAPLHVVSISPAVAVLAKALNPVTLRQARSPDAAAMVATVRDSLDAMTQG